MFLDYKKIALLVLSNIIMPNLSADPIFWHCNDTTAQSVLLKALFSKSDQASIVFMAFGSYAQAGLHGNYSYTQSLPPFIESLMLNPATRDRVDIILIDDMWSPENYKQSDLYRYISINKQLQDAVEKRLNLVQWYISNHENIIEKATSLLKKFINLKNEPLGGYLFLSDCSGGNLQDGVTKLYNRLINDSKDFIAKKGINHINCFVWNYAAHTAHWWRDLPISTVDRYRANLSSSASDPLTAHEKNIKHYEMMRSLGGMGTTNAYAYLSNDILSEIEKLTKEDLMKPLPFTEISIVPSKTLPMLEFKVAVKDGAVELTPYLQKSSGDEKVIDKFAQMLDVTVSSKK